MTIMQFFLRNNTKNRNGPKIQHDLYIFICHSPKRVMLLLEILSMPCAVRYVCFQDCIICMERLSCPSGYEVPAECSQSLQPNTVGKLTKCGHTFHMLCMLAMYNNGTKVCNSSPTLLTDMDLGAKQIKQFF